MDGKSARSVPNFADMQSAVLLTHALATPAVKYHKRQYCLQLLDSNGTYHLFQASNYDDLTSWVIAINRAAALHSTKPLAAPIGSCVDRFERPPLPKHPSKAAPEEQLSFYREKVDELIKDIAIEQVSSTFYRSPSAQCCSCCLIRRPSILSLSLSLSF